MYKIFAIDDQPLILETLKELLDEYNIQIATNPEAVLKKLDPKEKYFFIIDYKMPQMSGFDFLIEVKKLKIHYKAILISAHAEKEIIARAVNDHLIDKVLIKPFDDEEIVRVFSSLIQEEIDDDHYDIMEEIESLQNTAAFKDIIGLDSGLFDVFKITRVVAPLDLDVLLTGETGTGKEVFSNLIHHFSQRREGKLVQINCAAIPPDLLESELFGHKKGAFTSAVKDYPGKIILADKGTLYLDEIGELKPELQAKLLRVLEEKKVYPVGGNEPVEVDFRLVAATNLNLLSAIKEKKFRNDLYYRLSRFTINLPPLRERKKDIALLADHFLSLNCKSLKIIKKEFTKKAIELLKSYEWPGNIRELNNIVTQVAICTGKKVQVDDKALKKYLTATYQEYQASMKFIASVFVNEKMEVDDVVRDLVSSVIEHFSGNISAAASCTSLSRSKIYRIIKNVPKPKQ